MKELAQRMRPVTLSEVWGNSEAVRVLTDFLGKDGRPQTYLFKGNAGCGKTTLARAYAHDLGENIELREINASDTNGIDDMRALIDDLKYAFLGDVRAVILDEAHLLSSSAQSSILKLLEEPPRDTYLMLCTTDPQKLSKAIQTRCIQIEVHPLDEEDLVRHLRKVCRSEGIQTSVDVLEAIAEKAEGVPRVALKLLDKVAEMDEDTALGVLDKEGGVGEDADPDVKAICQGLLKGESWRKLAEHVKAVKSSNVEQVRRAVLGYMGAVLLNGGSPQVACIMGYFTDPFYDSGYAGLVYAVYCALVESRSA